MIKIDEKDRTFILENVPAAVVALEADCLDEVLEALDGYMTEEGYAPPDYQELNENGRTAERIIDRLYYGN